MTTNPSTGLTKQLLEKLKDSFENAMSCEKLYLRNDLTLHLLAKELKTNTSYLSRMIADSYQVNFPTYLNQLRIAEAQNMLRKIEFDAYSIEAISVACGYKSKSTFNKAFKELVGMAPSEFRKQINPTYST